MMTWAKVKLTAAVIVATVLTGGAGAVVIEKSLAASAQPPTVSPPASSFVAQATTPPAPNDVGQPTTPPAPIEIAQVTPSPAPGFVAGAGPAIQPPAAAPAPVGTPGFFGGGPRGPAMTPEELQKMMDEQRAKAAQQIKQQLGAGEEQWKTVEPLLIKAMVLQRTLNMMASSLMINRGGPIRGTAVGNAAGPVFVAGSSAARWTVPGAGPGAAPVGAGAPAPADAPAGPDLMALRMGLSMLESSVRMSPESTVMPDEFTAYRDALQTLRDGVQGQNATDDQLKQNIKAVRDARAAAQKIVTAAQEDLRKALEPRQESLLMAVGTLD